MSCSVLKSLLRKNAVLYWAFTAVIVGYFFMVILMYPMVRDIMAEIPIFGDDFADIGGYTAMVISELAWMFGLILFIMFVFKLAYKPVDSGSLSTHLMAGVSRTKYLVTVTIFLLIKLAVLFVLIVGVGVLSFVILGESFVFIDFFATTLLSMLALGAVTFIAFALAVIFANKKMALGLLIGIPVLLYVLLMVSNIHHSIEFIRWVTVFGWFVPGEVANGAFSLWWLVAIGYVALIALCAIVSAIIFKRKNLSL